MRMARVASNDRDCFLGCKISRSSTNRLYHLSANCAAALTVCCTLKYLPSGLLHTPGATCAAVTVATCSDSPVLGNRCLTGRSTLSSRRTASQANKPGAFVPAPAFELGARHVVSPGTVHVTRNRMWPVILCASTLTVIVHCTCRWRRNGVGDRGTSLAVSRMR